MLKLIRKFVFGVNYLIQGWGKVSPPSKAVFFFILILSLFSVLYFPIPSSDGVSTNYFQKIPIIIGLLTFLLSFFGSYLAGALNSITVFSDVTYNHWKNYEMISDKRIKAFLAQRSFFFFIRLTRNPIDDFFKADKQVIHNNEWDWQICFINPTAEDNRWDHFRNLIMTYIDDSGNAPKIVEDHKSSELSFRQARRFEELLNKLPVFFKSKGMKELVKSDFSTAKSILMSGTLSREHSDNEPQFIHFDKLKGELSHMRIESLIINLASTAQNPFFRHESADEFGKYILEEIFGSEGISGAEDLFFSTAPNHNADMFTEKNAKAILNLFKSEESED